MPANERFDVIIVGAGFATPSRVRIGVVAKRGDAWFILVIFHGLAGPGSRGGLSQGTGRRRAGFYPAQRAPLHGREAEHDQRLRQH